MKCPKCNYTSFDYNQVCPKCGNDNAQEQTRLKLSPNKPNPPFFLASLVAIGDSENLEIPDPETGMGASEGAPGGMDAQDLLIELDDMDSDDARPDSPESLDPSGDEIVFGTEDPEDGSLEPLDPAENEILFDLETASEDDGVESIDSDPLDKKGFPDVEGSDESLITVDEEGPDETLLTADVEEVLSEKETVSPEEMPEEVFETDLFLTDEPDDAEMPTQNTDPAEIALTPEEPDAEDLFLSLDDLPDSDVKAESSVSSGIEEDGIVFELEETSNQESAPAEKETPDEKGFWNSDEIDDQLAAFDLEESTTEKDGVSPNDKTDGREDVNLFSDKDIEPLDLDLSLEDMETKPK